MIFSKIEECAQKLPQAYGLYSEDDCFVHDKEFGKLGTRPVGVGLNTA
jgi:hypothetical protein